MPDELSKMIRVPTPLVEAVRELSRLHQQGRTKAILDGVQRLVTAIDSETDMDIDNVSQLISRLTERVDKLEAQTADSETDIDIASNALAISHLTERLQKMESDINSIAVVLSDLSVRVSDMEGVGDVGYATNRIAELEALDDIGFDSESTVDLLDQDDISVDREAIAQPEFPRQPPEPLSQSALAKRLGCSDKAIEKHRKQGDKENFAAWSRDRDPDGFAWTWEGSGGRGQPFRFVSID
jgi:uncharacterized coiled-coil protein SlyX